MKKSGLTERKMANRRFRTTEQAILVAYYELQDYPVARKIAKTANISRTTFYRHHKTVMSIPDDYEDYLLQVYKKKIKKFTPRKGATPKNVYLRTLAFIMSNHEVFSVLFQKNHKGIIGKMLDQTKAIILEEWKLGGDSEKMFSIYKNEILGVIEYWYGQGFSNQYLSATLDDILYLTRVARQKLLPLQ